MSTPEMMAIDDMKDMIRQVVTPEELSGSWYNKTMTAVSSSLRSLGGRTRTISADEYLNKPLPIEDYLNKPLPPLPQQPYFEYMFADAGLGGKDSSPPTQVVFKSGPKHQVSNAQHDMMMPDYEVPMAAEYPNKKRILEPKSQKSKATLQENSIFDSKSQMTMTAPAVQAPSSVTIRRVKKRGARDSFVANALEDKDFNIDLRTTKKIRVITQQVDSDVQSLRASSSSVYSSEPPTPPPKDLPTSPDTIYSALDLDLEPKSPTLTGYAGQFESYEAKYMRRRAAKTSKVLSFTSGDVLHPNNQFTHTNFIADPTYATQNYTKAILAKLPVRNAALTYADFQSDLAAELLTRSVSEENLRREAHRECAAARLEGCAVGQYRYYQGHMSLEEYKAAKMCVCWDGCYCSKLCTIYGDVLCPCNEWIVLHKD
ncbi:hypothetical protein EDD37DRAFT_608241 [Exophiala viscosa]|uniref:Uncharacterized protein n=1 Tax=Exophiala viscosa TaxID=2486360 RepID=A0AAN6DR58_9EURO|nr:hypothetical protein EDD36DRAFT_421044 [Exophiala viscosa]KAI1624756.1 hypothetical protein EDD37DRAFT_608241 [Exophiala viscosa]